MTLSVVKSLSVHPITRAAVGVVALSVLLLPAAAYGAEGASGKGRVIPAEVQALPMVTAPQLDMDAIAIEDAEDQDAGLAPRFAIPNEVYVTTENDGIWENVRGDTWVWRLRITSPGAVSLNLGFTSYFMPEGGSLVVRSSDGTLAIRPFTSEDNAEHGELWTPPLASDDIVVEVTVSGASAARLELELTSINVGYRSFGGVGVVGGGGGPIESGACNIDVVCPEGDLWRNEIPSAAVYSTGGARFCSGSMINNTAQDQKPYFLTANHCSINSGNAASLVVFWNYETSTCGGTPNGSLADFQTGAFFRAAYAPSDFTLVELDTAPNPAWGVTFAGWDRSGADASSAVGIHHPNVDEKRISFENQPTSTTSYSSNAVPGDGTHIRITDWDLGTTEGGSSGSPLFNQNHRVIGQLHGGGAACGNNASDWYGKLSVSWNGGGASSSRLSDWLDPTNTGATTVDTLVPGAGCTVNANCDDGLFCNGAETCVSGVCQAGSNPCVGQSCDEATNACVAGPSVVYSWNMNTNPGWTMQGQWAWGSPTGGGGQHAGPDPTSGATGTNVLGYNLAGDYANNLGETSLTTTAINCTNLINTSVRFQRWLGVEQPLYDHAYVRVSNNGTTWTTVWQNTVEVGDTAWAQFTYDISAVADGQATVFVRWVMGTTDGSWQYCGWNVDDVEIVATDLGGGPTCTDGILNQGETRIDCGGPCVACGCTSDVACGNGLFCDGTETCDGFGNCQPGTAVNCNDGVACTTDSCNEATSSCDNIANNASCDNGLFCDGVETCNATLGCQAGTAVNCNDAIACTTDACNEATNACDNTPSNAACDDGLFCNGTETCSATLGCQAGTAVNCNDAIACTTDACNETTNACDNTPSNAACDDGLFCNGAETCSATLGCQAGGNPCPGQTCDEVGNVCVQCTINADCDDGLFCNGSETCVAGACQAGTAVNCNDGVACTTDACNETTNSCDNTPSNAACDDGLFCNGAETCSATLGCQAGSNPCVGQTCDEVTNTCGGSGCAGACTNSVATFPYSENFDAGFGLWSNVTGDVFDWSRRSGSTPSSNTGPTGDHTTGSGFYVYTETSSPRVSGDTALLEGPCLDLSAATSATFSFWYNMNGASMGTLDVEVTTDCSVWTNVFTLSGNQGNVWTQSTIDLTPYVGSSTVKVRFRGTRGSSWQGDIAVDDISVTTGGGGGGCTTDANCDDGVFCNGADACVAGVCVPVTNPGVANGTFSGGASWTSNAPAGGSITYPANLNVVGTDAGAVGFTWASQSNVTVNGANLEFDLLSYSSGDTGQWDYPVFYLDGTYYGLNSNGTLGAATTGGTGGAGTVSNASPVSAAIHYIVAIDTLAGNAGPHTIGFGVHSVDGGFGAGTAVYDTVLPAGGTTDPCPGQTCDEVNNVCIP